MKDDNKPADFDEEFAEDDGPSVSLLTESRPTGRLETPNL